MKEHDPIKERAERIAARKWRNNDIRQKILAERNLPKRGDPSEKEREAEIAKVITNEERKGSKVKRFESKFKRELREMMEGQQKLRLQIYLIRLEHRRRILLKEKLKRLKAAEAEREEAEKRALTKKDLFGFPIETHPGGG